MTCQKWEENAKDSSTARWPAATASAEEGTGNRRKRVDIDVCGGGNGSDANKNNAFGMSDKSQTSAGLDSSKTRSSAESDLDLKLCEFLIADRTKWFTYQGSLTSYPFSQDVTWVVNQATEIIKSSDIKKIKETEQHTREPFPLHRRYVLRNFKTIARRAKR